MSDGVEGFVENVGGESQYDAYLYREQASLVEVLTRAYARRRLRPLLAEFEVLEVEREGEWLLAEGGPTDSASQWGKEREIWFLSRPDALLRHRVDSHLELLSFKTTGAWDQRKARDAEHDMQGLSEGIEVERRLGEWWNRVHEIAPGSWKSDPYLQGGTQAIFDYLRDCEAAPRILAIRYEFILKGERWKDRDLAAVVGVDWARVQKSHLLRRYECVSTPSRGANAGAFAVGDHCWSWEYMQEGGVTSKLAWQNWRSQPTFDEPGGVKRWIDELDASTLTMSPGDATLGMEPSPLGWSGPAQAVGFTAQHPLDAVFVAPLTCYRNDDDLRDMVEQIEASEVGVAEAVAAVNAAGDEDERRSLLNRHFPQSRHSCEYPTTCQFVPICYGGEDIRSKPLESGRFMRRVPNHPAEVTK